jgi:hypothetical protein
MNNIKIQETVSRMVAKVKAKGSSMSVTTIELDWTDDGADCLASVPGWKCPRCQTDLEPNVRHLCGDKVATAGKMPDDQARIRVIDKGKPKKKTL